MSGAPGIEKGGGFGRFFGGVSRAELVKDRWIPVTLSNPAPVQIGNHVGSLINLAGEYAVMENYVPQIGFTTLYDAWLFIIGAANQANMNHTISYDFGRAGQLYNVHTNTVNHQVDTTLNQISAVSCGADLAALAANDLLGITVTHRNVAPTTNFYVIGFLIRWT